MSKETNLKQKTKKGLYWKFFEQFATYGMQFVVGIVMARLLSPSDYGITALPAVFMALAAVFIDGSFGAALIRKPDLSEKDLSTAFYYSIGVGVLMYVIIYFSSPWIAIFYNTPVLEKLMHITALTFLIGPLNTPQSVILQRRLDFKTPARISIVNKIVGAVVGITAAYQGLGLWALVISSLTSSVIGLLQMWWVVKWLPKEKFNKDSFKYLWNFGNKMMAARLLDVAYGNIAPIVIGKFFSPAQLGLYNRARGYAELPSSNITGVIQGVTYPVLSKLLNDQEALERNYSKMIRTTNFMTFFIMFMLSALAKPLVVVMITEKWIDCVILLQILCFCLMWGPISMMNVNYLQVVGRTDLLLNVEFKKKAFGILMMAISLPFGLVPYCLSTIASQLFCVVVNIQCIGKISNMTLKKQFMDVIPIFCLGAVAYAGAIACTFIFDSYWLQLIIGGTIGTALYLGGVVLFKFEELQEVKYMLNRKK